MLKNPACLFKKNKILKPFLNWRVKCIFKWKTLQTAIQGLRNRVTSFSSIFRNFSSFFVLENFTWNKVFRKYLDTFLINAISYFISHTAQNRVSQTIFCIMRFPDCRKMKMNRTTLPRHWQKDSFQIIIRSQKHIKCRKSFTNGVKLSTFWRNLTLIYVFAYLYFLSKFQTGISQVQSIAQNPLVAEMKGHKKAFI